MSVRIGHAAIDENGKIHSGSAGDQTSKEVCTREWYNKPWTSVIRPKNSVAAEKIAKAMEQACANDNIGYDQYQRTTLYTQAKSKNWDLSKINVKCETDCSALVAVCVNAAGIAVSKDIYTGNQLQALKNTNEFIIFTSTDYLSSDKNLKRGDILLGKGHTAIALTDGSNIISSSLNKTVKWNGVTTTGLNVRTGAGTNYGLCSFAPLKKGTVVGVCDSVKTSSGTVWYYIKYNNQYGYASSKYIEKQIATDSTVKNKVDYADSYSQSIAGTYKATTGLNLRSGAGTSKSIQCVIPKNGKVTCYGHYTSIGGVKWYLVTYKTFSGFVSSKYLTK